MRTLSRAPAHPLRGIVMMTVLLLLYAGSAAAKTPFGIATPDSTGPAFTGPFGGFFARVALYQAEFYKALTHALSTVKGGGHTFLLLAGISFLYGVFHAVGPGHGKAVITSYLLVSRETVKRGIVISFAAAVMQGATAIAVVLVAVAVLHVTAVRMTHATDWIEIISYALVTAVGGWLLWAKTLGRGHHAHDHGHQTLDHVRIPAPALARAAEGGPFINYRLQHHACGAGHEDNHRHGDHSEPPNRGHDHCGHSHAPDPRLLSRPLTLSRAWAAILAVGIRPCSGAIIVLVFALSQKLLVAGIASVVAMSVGTFITVSSLAILSVLAKDVALRIAGVDTALSQKITRVVEIGGAAVVLLLGATLLGGALQGGVPG